MCHTPTCPLLTRVQALVEKEKEAFSVMLLQWPVCDLMLKGYVPAKGETATGSG